MQIDPQLGQIVNLFAVSITGRVLRILQIQVSRVIIEIDCIYNFI